MKRFSVLSRSTLTMCLMCVLFLPSITAQNYESDFKQAGAFFSSEKINYTFSAKLFKSFDGPVASVIKGQVKKYNNSFLMRYDNVITLVNREAYIMVDEEHKELYYSESGGGVNNTIKFDSTSFKDMLSSFDSIVLMKTSSKSLFYGIYKANAQIQTSIIELSKKDKRVLSLEYHYNKNFSSSYEKAVIVFSYHDTKTMIKSEFRTDNFVKVQSDRIIPSPKYKDYYIKQVITN